MKKIKYRGYEIVHLGGTWGDEYYADIPGTLFNAIYRKKLSDVKKEINRIKGPRKKK